MTARTSLFIVAMYRGVAPEGTRLSGFASASMRTLIAPNWPLFLEAFFEARCRGTKKTDCPGEAVCCVRYDRVCVGRSNCHH